MNIAPETNKLIDTKKPEKRWNWKKPKGKPIRNRSTFNYFYQHVRARLMELSGGKKIGGIGNLSCIVSKEWKEVKTSDPALLAECEHRAAKDLTRYRSELAAWVLSNGKGGNRSALNVPMIVNATIETPMTDNSMFVSMPNDGERSVHSQDSDDDFEHLGEVCKTFYDRNGHFLVISF